MPLNRNTSGAICFPARIFTPNGVIFAYDLIKNKDYFPTILKKGASYAEPYFSEPE